MSAAPFLDPTVIRDATLTQTLSSFTPVSGRRYGSPKLCIVCSIPGETRWSRPQAFEQFPCASAAGATNVDGSRALCCSYSAPACANLSRPERTLRKINKLRKVAARGIDLHSKIDRVQCGEFGRNTESAIQHRGLTGARPASMCYNGLERCWTHRPQP